MNRIHKTKAALAALFQTDTLTRLRAEREAKIMAQLQDDNVIRERIRAEREARIRSRITEYEAQIQEAKANRMNINFKPISRCCGK